MSAVGIRLLGRLMDDLWIAQIGILSGVLANILMAVSAYLPHRDIIPFIVPCVRMLGRMQHSVITSGMSKLVPQDRQGSVFALLYCFEAINKLTQSLVFLPVYRATLHWFPGFGFLIGPAISFIITVPVLGQTKALPQLQNAKIHSALPPVKLRKNCRRQSRAGSLQTSGPHVRLAGFS
ncbi:hypothetical protein Bbelb_206020 [Branchiostoma belcheri]|nr:hypothetical protein Bbelb_206020 [Branchiostoma belcheri]